jgi:hypothetical protein
MTLSGRADALCEHTGGEVESRLDLGRGCRCPRWCWLTGMVSSSSSSGRPAGRPEALANVRPLRPVRVLLSGRDTRYVRAIRFLLSRRGFETRQAASTAALLEETASFVPDVVLLVDAGTFGETARQAAALLCLYERVSIVVSTPREGSPDASRLRFVPNWSSFDDLVDAVERSWAELPPATRV